MSLKASFNQHRANQLSGVFESIDNHPIIRRYMLYYSKKKEIKFWYEILIHSFKYALLISPFATIALSRQLSVLPHRELYGDYTPQSDAKSKDLMKLESQLTLRDCQNLELTKSAGMLEGQKPYRAPIYENYLQTIKALYRQGLLGFYKGTFWRLFFIVIPLRIRMILDYHILDHYPSLHRHSYLKDLITFTLADFMCHPAFMTESRYVLQNRLTQFHVYSNILKLRFRSFHEIWVGGYNHFFKNLFMLLGMFVMRYTIFPENYIACAVAAQVFSYPVLTCMRRLVCQTPDVPGMLPLRYLNLLHALALIKKEEGLLRGLYRGFIFHTIFVYLWYDLVFDSAKLSQARNKMKEDEELLMDDPIFDEIKRRKINSVIK